MHVGCITLHIGERHLVFRLILSTSKDGDRMQFFTKKMELGNERGAGVFDLLATMWVVCM